MKKIIYLKNKNFQVKLNRQLSCLSQKIFDHYKNYTESAYCIEQIEKEAVMYYQNKIDVPLLLSDFNHEIAMTHATSQHYVIRIVDNKQLQVAVHIASAGTSIPVHAHPDSLSLLFVQQGELLLEQFSIVGDSMKSTRLKEQGCSVGLKHLYNMHAVHVTKPATVFISLRCKNKRSYKLLARAFSLIAYSASSLFLPSYACSDYEESQLVFEENIQRDNSHLVEIANEIRVGANGKENNDEILYKASKWYLEAASKGNAEAEYWLGVMYLKGAGLTENSDEALVWIAKSAGHEYSPAKKLLKYILSHDEALDC